MKSLDASRYADADGLWASCRVVGNALLHPKYSEIIASPQPGDVLFYQCKPGYYHYGIFVGKFEGKDCVIDNDANKDGSGASSITRKTYSKFAEPAKEAIKVVLYDETDGEGVERRRTTVYNAERMLKDCRGDVYDPTRFNCQQFVFCCQGIRCDHFPQLGPAFLDPLGLTKSSWDPAVLTPPKTR